MIFSFFNKARYIRTAEGLEMYQGIELIGILSESDRLGIFFEVAKLPSGTSLVHISKHGDAREVMLAYNMKKKIWARARWPVNNLHVVWLNVSAITDPILEEINAALFIEDLASNLGTRIMELLMTPGKAAPQSEFRTAA